MLTTVAWAALMWAEWTLVFASAETALIDTLSNRGSITWTDWVYYTGYTIFTLGNGDYAPETGTTTHAVESIFLGPARSEIRLDRGSI